MRFRLPNEQQALPTLVARRAELVEMRVAESNRLARCASIVRQKHPSPYPMARQTD